MAGARHSIDTFGVCFGESGRFGNAIVLAIGFAGMTAIGGVVVLGSNGCGPLGGAGTTGTVGVEMIGIDPAGVTIGSGFGSVEEVDSTVRRGGGIPCGNGAGGGEAFGKKSAGVGTGSLFEAGRTPLGGVVGGGPNID